MTPYPYSISEDFTSLGSNKVSPSVLTKTIENNETIVTTLEGITTNEDTDSCIFYFITELSEPEITALNTIVANHIGGELPDPKYSTEFFNFSKDGDASGMYLKIENILNGTIGQYMPRNFVVIGIYCQSGSGDTAKTFELRDENETVIQEFSYSGDLEYINTNLNIALTAETRLKVWVSDVGEVVTDTLCQVEVEWRPES